MTVFYDKCHTGRYKKDRAIKPDIVIWNQPERSVFIIDVTVPNDYGFNRAEWGKIKYQDLKNDLKTTYDRSTMKKKKKSSNLNANMVAMAT